MKAPPRIDVSDRVDGGRPPPAFVRRTARSLAEVLFATEDGPADPERLRWLEEDLADYLSRSGPRTLAVFSLGCVAIGLLAPLLARRLPPFHRLSEEARAEALERLESSPLGLAALGVRAPLCFIYYEHPESAAAIGYDGEPLLPLGKRR